MPIKKSQKRNVAVSSSSADPRTASFSASGTYGAYAEPAELSPAPLLTPDGMIPPTTNHDLNYFFQVADGDLLADEFSTTPTIVLNLFRATDIGRKPVAERIILGQDKGAPYYALHAAPSLTSSDEFNTLQITRRQPLSGNHVSSSVVDILPKLDLGAKGTMMIARIKHSTKSWNIMWNGPSAECPTMLKCSVSVWTEGPSSENILVFKFENDWRSMDDGPMLGGIAVRVGTFFSSNNSN